MTRSPKTAPRLGDIEAARARIAGHARVTPVYPSETLSRLIARLKREGVAQFSGRNVIVPSERALAAAMHGPTDS